MLLIKIKFSTSSPVDNKKSLKLKSFLKNPEDKSFSQGNIAEVLSFNQNSIDERIKRRERKFFGRTGKRIRKELPLIEARINRLNLFLKEVEGETNQEGATLTMPCPISVQGVAEVGFLPVSSLKRKIKGSSSSISSDYKEAFKKALERIKSLKIGPSELIYLYETGLLNPYGGLKENKLLFNPVYLWSHFLGEGGILPGISAVMEEMDVLSSKWQKLLKPKQAHQNFLNKIEELIYGLENDFVVIDEEYGKLDLEILKRLRELLFIYDWQELDELIKFWYEWELLRLKSLSIQETSEIERKLYSAQRGLTKIWMGKIAEKVGLDLGVKESLVRAVLSEGIKGLDIDRKLRMVKLIYKYLSFIKNKEEFLRCLQGVMDEIKERKDTLKKYKKIKKTSYYSWLRNERKKAFQILFSSAKEDFLIRERLKTISAMFRHGGWQRVIYEVGPNIYLLGDVDKRFERIGEDVIGALKELITLAGKVKEKDEIREEDIEEWRKISFEVKKRVILLYEEYKKLAEEVNLEERVKELKVPEYIAKYSGRDIYIQLLYQRLQKDFPELVKFISLLNDFIEGKLNKEIVSLRPILEEAIKDAYVYHQEKDLKIHLNIEKEIQLNTNSYALKTAILRILSNGFHLKLTSSYKNISP